MIAYKKLIMIRDNDDVVGVFSPVITAAWMPNEYGYACLSVDADIIYEDNYMGIHAMKDRDNSQLNAYPGDLIELWLSGKIIEGERGYRAEKAQTNIKVALRPKEYYIDLLNKNSEEYRELATWILDNQINYMEEYCTNFSFYISGNRTDFIIDFEKRKKRYLELIALRDNLNCMLEKFA
jgi:hypothetical protein